MVGTPTSRGYTACRRQKKKCVSDNHIPPCQRCRRLRIDCLELGQQRLKFQSENDRFAIRVKKAQDSKDITRVDSTLASATVVQRPRLLIQTPPSSALTRLRAGCIRAVDASVDISFHLPWNYGPYLEQVPQRLGNSKAFDTTAEALVACYSCLRRNVRPGRDEHALGRYSKALKALADALDNPREATSTETLASISMLMVFESIAGFGPKSVLAHAGGAVKVFQERGQTQPRNEFEAMLQLSLRGAMVMQALFLPSLPFTKEKWSGLVESEIGGSSPEEKAFRCLGIYVRLMHEANALFGLRQYSEESTNTLANLMLEIMALRERLEPEVDSLRKTFWQMTKTLKEIGSTAVVHARSMNSKSIWDLNTYHAHIGRSYGLAMATKILINSLLQAIWRCLQNRGSWTSDMTWQKHQSLAAENANLAREVCQLAKEVDHHRPLGTVYMSVVLRLASIGASGMTCAFIIGSAATNSFEDSLIIAKPSMTYEPGSVIDQVDSLIESEYKNTSENHMLVEDELNLLLSRYCGDLEEPSSHEENRHAFEALKDKFTFPGFEGCNDRAFSANME